MGRRFKVTTPLGSHLTLASCGCDIKQRCRSVPIGNRSNVRNLRSKRHVSFVRASTRSSLFPLHPVVQSINPPLLKTGRHDTDVGDFVVRRSICDRTRSMASKSALPSEVRKCDAERSGCAVLITLRNVIGGGTVGRHLFAGDCAVSERTCK